MTPQELLTAYAEKYGLDGCVFDQDGLCRLVIDADVAIDLERRPDGKSMLMQCALGRVNTADARLLARLLGANMHYASPEDAVLALDTFNGELLLLTALSPLPDAEGFEERLEAFAREADDWREFLAAPEEEDLPGVGGVAAPAPGSFA